MQAPLTEIEYAILDQLADGAQSLPMLVRLLRESARGWDVGVIIHGLVKLADGQLIHYAPLPGGPNYSRPAPEQVSSLVHEAEAQGTSLWWVEMTENGQHMWEVWQPHQGS